ncbi:5109_t:CDS:2, partial [Rhizophagus irregularis]
MSKRKAVYNNQVEVETGTKKNPRTLSKKRREMNIEETNQLLLDICNWLLKNPDILRLANEMNESSYVISSKNTEDESVKCLFLRTRNLSSEALDDLVVKIFQFKIYTSEARSHLEKNSGKIQKNKKEQ